MRARFPSVVISTFYSRSVHSRTTLNSGEFNNYLPKGPIKANIDNPMNQWELESNARDQVMTSFGFACDRLNTCSEPFELAPSVNLP